VGILMKTFLNFDEILKDKKAQLNIQIPETLICSYDQSIIFLRNNEKGLMEAT
jgi:hypothetical protein